MIANQAKKGETSIQAEEKAGENADFGVDLVSGTRKSTRV